MKLPLFVSFLLILLLTSCNGEKKPSGDLSADAESQDSIESQEEQLTRFTSIPSGKIVYQYTNRGNVVRTDKILFEKWGNRMIMNIKTDTEHKTYTWDLEAGHEFNHLRELYTEVSEKPFLLKGISKPVSGKKLPDTVNLLNKPCEVYQIDVKMVKGGKNIEGYEKSWRYKGVELKTETKGLPDPGDLSIKKATAFEENITIDDQLFAIPKRYENSAKYKSSDNNQE